MNNNLKRMFFDKKRIFLFAFFCVIMLSYTKSVSASTILQPHVLSSGTEADQGKFSKYDLTSTGEELVPLKIEKNGCLLMRVTAEKAAFTNIAVHKKADGSDFPTYLSAQCTDYNGKRDLIISYFPKGTYYLKFPANKYTLELQMYSNAEQTVKSGSTIAAYCDYYNPAMSKFKATKNGYVTISQKWLRNTTEENSVTLCDSKGNNISDAVCDHKVDEPISFPVKKGKTYKFKITTLNIDGQQFYQMKVKFTAREDKAGASKAKAKTMPLRKETVGLCYGEDKTSKVHWYKFKNPKAQKLTLTLSGEASSGSLKVIVYDTQGKKTTFYHLAPGPAKSNTYTLKTRSGKSVLPKGTYYIKLVKNQRSTTGIYSLKVKAGK